MPKKSKVKKPFSSKPKGTENNRLDKSQQYGHDFKPKQPRPKRKYTSDIPISSSYEFTPFDWNFRAYNPFRFDTGVDSPLATHEGKYKVNEYDPFNQSGQADISEFVTFLKNISKKDPYKTFRNKSSFLQYILDLNLQDYPNLEKYLKFFNTLSESAFLSIVDTVANSKKEVDSKSKQFRRKQMYKNKKIKAENSVQQFVASSENILNNIDKKLLTLYGSEIADQARNLYDSEGVFLWQEDDAAVLSKMEKENKGNTPFFMLENYEPGKYYFELSPGYVANFFDKKICKGEITLLKEGKIRISLEDQSFDNWFKTIEEVEEFLLGYCAFHYGSFAMYSNGVDLPQITAMKRHKVIRAYSLDLKDKIYEAKTSIEELCDKTLRNKMPVGFVFQRYYSDFGGCAFLKPKDSISGNPDKAYYFDWSFSAVVPNQYSWQSVYDKLTHGSLASMLSAFKTFLTKIEKEKPILQENLDSMKVPFSNSIK